MLEGPDGRDDLVFHTAAPNEFGHERRSDRVAEMLLAWDTFGAVPRHVEAIDVGVVDEAGELVSLASTSEAYLRANGAPYATELRAIAARGEVTDVELEHARSLARLLVEIHAASGSQEGAYVRAWRDPVGSGEGIAGIIDGYGEGGRGGVDVPGASRARLAEIEVACLRARQRHARRVVRLTRTHGDFHPFNVLFDGDRAVLLDTSRGSEGEPADDVACLAINFLFFGLEHRDRWASGLGRLWDAFFETYVRERPDPALFEVIAPFFAWRALVVTSPAWYPQLRADDRDRMLGFAERALGAARFEPAMGREAMR